MKLKSTLWALAFACAAVSCSDDLEGGPNNNEGNELNGEKAFIKVAVSTSVTTKAPNPGEEGDGDEAGTAQESAIKNLTVFLFRNSGDNVETDFAFKSTSTICAAGYASTDGNMSPGSPEHSFYKEVEIENLQPNASLVDGKPYGVIAIANLGETSANNLIEQIATGENASKIGSSLANFNQTSLGDNSSGFVMSTHKMQVGSDISKVTPINVSSAGEAPLVNVYVERLAAKIRINEYNDNNFVYDVTGHNGDKVILSKVDVVNQLNSGSYLIKRVTENAEEGKDLIAGTDVTALPVDNDTYLGDEVGSSADPALNFVVDPWSRSKTVIADGGSVSVNGLSYINPYSGTSMAALISNKAKTLYGNESFETDDKLDICYTMENTTSMASSQNGYSTGAIFEATYYPASWTVASTSTDNGIDTGTNNFESSDGGGETTYTAADFYIYENAVFKDKDAILAYALAHVIPDGYTGTVYTYKDFDGEELDNNFSLETFKSSISAGANDPYGYVKYLNGLSNETPVADILSFSEFLSSENNNLEKEPASVEFHENGKTYYPFWIRHANNDDPRTTGIMEFGIVRNNIYDLTVNGVNNYGQVEAPNPGDPDENTKVGISVVVYVKDWTLRTNDGIIL